MKVTALELADVALINLPIHADARGFFIERILDD